MFVLLFSSFIFAKTEICICNNECSSLCPSITFLSSLNEAFNSYINSKLQKESELELNFYSKVKDHIFDVDLSQFSNIKVQFKALLDSKSIKVALKREKSLIKKISIEPNQQVSLPQIDENQINTMNNLNIKNTPDQSIITNRNGLINVTCDQLQYSDGWVMGFTGSADHGSYTMKSSSKVSLKFKGTKVHVFGHMEVNSAYANIFIDSKLVDRVNFNSNPAQHSVVFSSDDLTFGEHLIEVQHDGNDDQSLVIVSIIYDPLPKVDRQIFGFDKMEKEADQWQQSDTNPLIFSSQKSGAVGTFKFLGTRFWLTGVRDGSHGKFSIQIDENKIEVDNLITNPSIANGLAGHYPALLYQSEVLDFKEHTVTITVADNEVSLVNFLYTTQPYNGVFVNYNELTKQKYWKEDNGGYLSREVGSSLSIFGFFNHLWVVGNNEASQAFMNIYYNDEIKETIDTSKISSSISDKVLLYESKNSEINTYEFMIENNGDNVNPNSLRYLHISYLYYLNDELLKVNEEHETINIDNMDHDNGWTVETKSDDKKNLFTDKKDSKVTVKFSGDKFWLVGSVGPNYGNIDIILDDKKFSTVSLYREREEDNVVYYSSPPIDFAYHILTLSNPSTKGINIGQIHFQQYPDDQGMLTNLDGLINITCDKLEYSGSWDIYLKSGNADHGSYTQTKGSKAWYTFNGTKVHVFANREGNSAYMIIRIDDVVVARSNLNVPNNHAAIVYSSGDLPFGEHKIEIENDGAESGTTAGKFITLSAFLIDPLPKFGGFKLSYKDHIKKEGEWEEDTTGTPTFSSSSEGASITFKFYGSRFWVTGERGTEIGNADIIIDETETIEVREKVGPNVPQESTTNGNKAILFYESRVYPIGEHTITIKAVDKQRISLVNILYSNQPYNGICVGYNELIKEGTWEEEKKGYKSQEAGSKLSVQEFMNHLFIFGNSEENKGLMNIYLNDQKTTDSPIDTSKTKTNFSPDVLLYDTKLTLANTYDIVMEHHGDNAESSDALPLHISYLYYINEKKNTIDQEHKTINANEISHDNNWKEVTQGEITTLVTDKKGSKITLTITCSKFWISGSLGPNKGSVDILLDDERLSRVSLYQEKDEHNIIYYESPESVEFGYHTLTLSNPASKEINVYQIHYYQSPDDQSIIDNLDGLINITCDKFNYNGNWAICSKNINADWGSYIFEKGKSASYTFNGTKVYVYANREPSACNAIIKLDNKIAAYVDLYQEGKDTEIVFSSNYLPFGEHTIEIINDGRGTETNKALVLASLFVNPLPKQGGFKLGYNDRFDKEGEWIQTNEGTPVFSSSSEGASITFKFHGTRFWITGVRGSDTGLNIGKLDVKIDENEPITVNEIVGGNDAKAFADGNKAVLLYQSTVYELKDHTVKISKNGDHDISLVNFFYSNQPYNGMVATHEVLNKQGSWTEEENGYISHEKGSSLSINEYFNHVLIVGNNKLNTALMNVCYNSGNVETVDTSKTKTEYSTDVLLYESKNDLLLDTYEFKIENNDESNQKSLHISYLYYMNNENITINEEFETINIAGMSLDGSWTEETKAGNIVILYTKKKGSKASLKFSGDKFWLVGSVGPNYGNIDIILDDKKFSTVSLYREREEDNVIFYVSPSIEFSYHTLTLSNPSTKGINIHKVHYQQTPDDQTMIENLDGLINITCDKLEYNSDGGWDIYLKGNYADHGSYTQKKGGKAWYTFNGTKVHVFAIREKNSPYMVIRIDDKVVARSNLNVSKNRAEIIFTSDDLPFGEHKIEIENDGAESGESTKTPLTLCAFLIDPLPKFGGFKLSYKDHIKKEGEWEVNTTGTPTFSSSSEGASITFKFYGSRFWVTGERGTEIGNANIIIDETETIEVREQVTSGSYKETTNGNKAILFYESRVYPIGEHTITIKAVDKQRISLVNILYSNQPYNGICIGYNELIKEGTWEEEKKGYKSQEAGSKLSVQEFMNHLFIFGNSEENKGLMNIYLNDQKTTDSPIDTSKTKTNFSPDVLLYDTNEITSYPYKIVIEHQGDKTVLPLHIGYLYYLNDGTIEVDKSSIKIDSTEITNRTGKWSDESISGNTNNLWTEEKDSSITVEFTGGRFWLIGSVGPNYDYVNILIDDEKIATVSLYQEKPNTNFVYFESQPISFKEHRLTIVNTENKPFSVYSIYYDPVTPTFEFTPSKSFTSSDSFTQSETFPQSDAFSPSFLLDPMENLPSCSVSDSSGNRTLHGRRCEFQSNDKTNVVQIARSNFTDISYTDDGGAIHILNSGFDCNSVEFTNCSSKEGGGGAIYIKNSFEQDKNISLSGLVFSECHAIFGGAVFIFSISESNSVLIDSCIFEKNSAERSNSNQDNKNLCGGSALFLAAENSNIHQCSFKKNGPASAVKIFDASKLNENSRSLIRNIDNYNKILFTDCIFEISDDSKSSIDIDNVFSIKVDVVDCRFTGKLNEGMHYIEGKMLPDLISNVVIKSCTFEDQNEIAVNLVAVGEKAMKAAEKKNTHLTLILGFVALFTTTLILTVMNLIKSALNQEENDQIFNGEI